MKLIGPSADKEWNRKIVAQLSFIKRHLRYPITRQTAWPVASLAASLPVAAFFFYTVAFIKPNSSYSTRWLLPLLLLVLMITPLVVASRYLKTLRFIAVPANEGIAANMILLQKFLQYHHFAYARHAEAPEVFQMISQNIGALQNEREIVVFIANDRRILVNSHFTRSGLNAPIGAPRYEEMARMLNDFLKSQQQSPGAQGLRVF